LSVYKMYHLPQSPSFNHRPLRTPRIVMACGSSFSSDDTCQPGSPMVVAPLALKPDHLFGPEVDDVSPPRTLRLVGPRVVERPPGVNRATTSPQWLSYTLRVGAIVCHQDVMSGFGGAVLPDGILFMGSRYEPHATVVL